LPLGNTADLAGSGRARHVLFLQLAHAQGHRKNRFMLPSPTLLRLLFLAIFGWQSFAAAEPRPLVSSDTFLAIDDTVFESVDKMSLSLAVARKHPSNPLLTNRPEGPDAWRAGFPWVLLDGGRFRMWYLARDAAGDFFTCYAESSDGIEWTRPALGLVEHRGSKANNICYRGHTLFPTVYRDHTATDPERRYIATIYGVITPEHFTTPAQRQRYGQSQPSIKCLAYSPDGLHWREDHSQLFPIPAKVEGGTLYRMHDKWFLIHQQNASEYPEVHPFSRFLSVSHSRHLKEWQFGDRPAFNFDRKFNGALQTHVTPGYQNYGNVIVGAQGILYDNVELIDHETDLTLILSNDGRTWRQPKPAQPLSYLLRRGDRHEWDRSFVVQGNFVSTGAKTLLYYNGSQWGNVDTDGIQIGVAELRLDGYGTLAPHIGWNFGQEGPFEGSLQSRPIAIQEKGLRLYLNVQAGADSRDELRVELTDPNGTALDGFRFADCGPMNRDSVGLPVAWQGRADLSALAGQRVRVKICIKSHNPQRTGKIRVQQPQLYAFYFDQPTLHLQREQAVHPSGLERQHLSDPLHPALAGIEITAEQPVTVTLRSVNAEAAEIVLNGQGPIRLRGDQLRAARLQDQELTASDGVYTVPLSGTATVHASLAPDVSRN
jgi:hypothetical protein